MDEERLTALSVAQRPQCADGLSLARDFRSKFKSSGAQFLLSGTASDPYISGQYYENGLYRIMNRS